MPERKHILVVEDDVDIAEMLRFLLDMEGYAVSIANSGSEALGQFAMCVGGSASLAHAAQGAACSGLPNLILLDLQLPDMDGEEVIAQLNQRAPVVPPVIVLTAKRQQAAEVSADTIGAAGMFLKPFEIQALLDRIDRVLTHV